MVSTWKNTERRVASLVGGVRNILSGGAPNSPTKGDVVHPDLYVEVKHFTSKLSSSVWVLMEKASENAKKEGKIPLLVIHMKHRKKYLCCMWLEENE